ncbi:DNA replication licensing factor MCM8 [Chondrus crispus]|uniref:DNA helicase n=1 Tax=Chondrus crispus TaxID=2769 RepID=R7QKR5_CHOCR|nr:DNA replication licensing factor MCM8 [Chondrus crispus]CDF38674.1 DNA replication licensing factor MCM8 [Chondrus crispus]|eukprot:XP_005718579.1 DNA replication licensing factor MCM8 [Chondrus crispus]
MTPPRTPSDSDEDVFDGGPAGAQVLPPSPPPASPAPCAPPTGTTWSSPLGWSVFFPDAAENDPACAGRAKAVRTLLAFFASPPGHRLLTSIPCDTFTLPLDFHHLAHRSSPPVLRGIAAAIPDAPDDSLASIGLAACRAVERLAGAANDQRFPGMQDLNISRENRLWPRVYNFAPVTAMKSLRGNSVGKFVTIKGTVVRVSNIRQQLVSMQFECAKCGENQFRSFVDYKYSVPYKCPTDKCRSKMFAPLRETAETVDWQKIREGRMPRTIDAELFSDLIDTCIPGDIVTVCGTVRVSAVENGGGNKAKCLYYMYLEANSTSTSRNRNASAKDPFGFLVHSAVPSIYGHEIVKAGLLLSLFGGSPKERIGPSSTSKPIAIRRDIHCLVVGDPGLGKSQMLKAISNIAPRGVYVCGNTTTTAGLTVTVVREAGGDFALEAGALVLGDRGVCCIDEFDKMGAEHGALLEAMEQQSVSVAKAGLLCNLSARTTVVAAANPVGGHYDRSRTVCENLKIALPLLSRFDIVFILMDKADHARDQFISEHVMKMFGMRSSNQSDLEGETHTSLQNRLRSMRVSDPLPPRLFRQYIAYARAHVHPALSEGAKREFQEFYLQLRKSTHEQSIDTTPITTRQLESLVRLGEARARAVMRTVVTAQDARDVIEVMRESMIETLTDESGTLDLGRASGMSRSRDARRFVSAMHAEAKRGRSAMFSRKMLRGVAESIGISGERFQTLVETVNHQGYLMKKRGGKWELQGSSFADEGYG